MRKRIAIIDVPKDGGNPVLAFPEGTSIRKRGDLWRISFGNKTAFVRVLRNTATRWIAFAVAPERAFLWLESRLGADVYELTWQRWQNNKATLANLGLVGETIGGELIDGELVGGEEVLRLPHAICGQSPFLRNPNA